MEKKCADCQLTKSLSQFYQRKSRKNSWLSYCKTCSAKRTLIRQQGYKLACVSYKGGKCIQCGYSRCMAALEFHHINPDEKIFNIASRRLHSFNQTIRSELDKCNLICVNCHRENHYERISQLLASFPPATFQESGKPIRAFNQLCSCGGAKSPRASSCKNCHSPTLKISWPSTENLRSRVMSSSFLQVGKELGVSDNAIRKRIKKHPNFHPHQKSLPEISTSRPKPSLPRTKPALLPNQKSCVRCYTSKPLTEFYSNQKSVSYCKSCVDKDTLCRQRVLKDLCVAYKGQNCFGCGYMTCSGALEFHHRDFLEKDFSIGSQGKTSFNEKLRIELDKCDLLCGNCHREHHANEFLVRVGRLELPFQA